jgi:hypothetical protein
MRRSDQEATRIVRSWLDEGSAQLSPRVHDAVMREFPGSSQDGALGSQRMRMTAFAVVAVAAAAFAVAVLAGSRLPPGVMPGGVAPTAAPSAGATSSPTPEGEPTATPGDDGRVFDCETWDLPTPPMGVGLIGFPTEGAEPSLPLSGQLVDSWLVDGGDLTPYQGTARLYADGRLIWNYANMPELGDMMGTGYIVQRLTAEGVELVRQADVSDKDPMVLNDCLPADAWADQRYGEYVPTNYAVCLGEAEVALLPVAARDLLEGRDLTPVEEGTYAAGDCLTLTLDEARALDAALQDAGFVPGWGNEQTTIPPGTLYQLRGIADGHVIFFEPVFPHGEVGCSYCG